MKTLRVMIVCAVMFCVGVLPCEGKKREYSRDYSDGANHGVKGKMVVEGDKSKCGGKVHGWRRRGIEGAKVTLYKYAVDRDRGGRTILSRQSVVTGEDGDYQFDAEVQPQSDEKYEMVLIVVEKDGYKREWGTLDLQEEFLLDFSMREDEGYKKGKDVGLTAAELIERIGESEREICDVEAYFSNTIANWWDLEMDWAYKQDGRKEFHHMVSERPYLILGPPETKNNQYREKWAFDGTNTYRFMYSKELEEKQGSVMSTLYRHGSFGSFGGNYVTPARFLGWQFFSGDRRLLSEYLRGAEKVTLGDKLQEVERNWCAAIEAVGIAGVFQTRKGDRTDYYNYRFWVDVGRGYRPLRIEKYLGGERRDPWGQLRGVYSGVRLRKIDDVWFPVRGSYNGYHRKYVLPPESVGLDEWEKIPRKEQEKVGTLLQWPSHTKPNPDGGDGRNLMRVRVPSVKINKGIAEEKFKVDFPVGTIVQDNTRKDKHLKYMAGGFDDPDFVAKTEGEKIMKQLRDGEVEIDAELRGEFIEALRDFSVEGEPGKWIAAIRALTIIGKPAVADLTEELRRTRNAPTQSAIAIALRVIGDDSAVPALIDALEEAQFGNQHFQGEADCNLHQFYMKHDLGQEDLQLFFHRPVIEITQSLEMLTGHSEGHDHFDLFIKRSEDIYSPKSIRMRREARKEAAERWRKWWEKHTTDENSNVEKDGPTARELLRKFSETFSRLQSFIIKSESSNTIESSFSNGKKEKSYYSSELRFDGDRVSFRNTLWGGFGMGTKLIPKEEARYQSFSWYGKEYYQYSTAPTSTTRPQGILKIHRTRKYAEELISRGCLFGILFGYSSGDDKRLDSVLREADAIEVERELAMIADSLCYVINATTPYGKYKVWLDPEHGYNIARMEVRKDTGDLMFGNIMSKKAKYSGFLEKVHFEKIDEVWVPMEATIVTDRIRTNGDFFKAVSHHKRTEIIINPDFESLNCFVPDDIENGAEVITWFDDYKYKYKWQDGKLVDSSGSVVDLEELRERGLKQIKSKMKE